jgi:hypothetical protein
MIPAYDRAMRKLPARMIKMQPKTCGSGFNSDPGMEKLNRSRYASKTEQDTMKRSIRKISQRGVF